MGKPEKSDYVSPHQKNDASGQLDRGSKILVLPLIRLLDQPISSMHQQELLHHQLHDQIHVMRQLSNSLRFTAICFVFYETLQFTTTFHRDGYTQARHLKSLSKQIASASTFFWEGQKEQATISDDGIHIKNLHFKKEKPR